jgi:ceroid-lipofuscinosis MFS transporter 7
MSTSYSKIQHNESDENSHLAPKIISAHSNETRKSTGLLSIIMVVLCVLVGDMARGILFPTLWLLVQSHGGGRFYQGCAVSAFSAGRIVSSPIFGYGSEKIGYRYVLMICNLIIFLGCYLYAMSNSLSMVIGGQFVIGFGAGR